MSTEFPKTSEGLSAYLDGELSPAETAVVEEWLRASADARQTLTRLRLIEQELKAFALDARGAVTPLPADWADGVLARIVAAETVVAESEPSSPVRPAFDLDDLPLSNAPQADSFWKRAQFWQFAGACSAAAAILFALYAPSMSSDGVAETASAPQRTESERLQESLKALSQRTLPTTRDQAPGSGWAGFTTGDDSANAPAAPAASEPLGKSGEDRRLLRQEQAGSAGWNRIQGGARNNEVSPSDQLRGAAENAAGDGDRGAGAALRKAQPAQAAPAGDGVRFKGPGEVKRAGNEQLQSAAPKQNAKEREAASNRGAANLAGASEGGATEADAARQGAVPSAAMKSEQAEKQSAPKSAPAGGSNPVGGVGGNFGAPGAGGGAGGGGVGREPRREDRGRAAEGGDKDGGTKTGGGAKTGGEGAAKGEHSAAARAAEAVRALPEAAAPIPAAAQSFGSPAGKGPQNGAPVAPAKKPSDAAEAASGGRALQGALAEGKGEAKKSQKDAAAAPAAKGAAQSLQDPLERNAEGRNALDAMKREADRKNLATPAKPGVSAAPEGFSAPAPAAVARPGAPVPPPVGAPPLPGGATPATGAPAAAAAPPTAAGAPAPFAADEQAKSKSDKALEDKQRPAPMLAGPPAPMMARTPVRDGAVGGAPLPTGALPNGPQPAAGGSTARLDAADGKPWGAAKLWIVSLEMSLPAVQSSALDQVLGEHKIPWQAADFAELDADLTSAPVAEAPQARAGAAGEKSAPPATANAAGGKGLNAAVSGNSQGDAGVEGIWLEAPKETVEAIVQQMRAKPEAFPKLAVRFWKSGDADAPAVALNVDRGLGLARRKQKEALPQDADARLAALSQTYRRQAGAPEGVELQQFARRLRVSPELESQLLLQTDEALAADGKLGDAKSELQALPPKEAAKLSAAPKGPAASTLKRNAPPVRVLLLVRTAGVR